MTRRGIPVRIFLTCWLVYAIHMATNTVREIYPAMAIGDHFSFRVDDFAHMHPDLFEKPGYGWHINGNPGASMLAAVPYAIFRPLTDRIVRRVNQQRAASGAAEPPSYNSPWPLAREFFKAAWRRGYDIKFGLAAILMQWFCMAPICAAGAAAMFLMLRRLLVAEKPALWLTLLYAFGTPLFFRAGYLNHNMIMGHIAFLGFMCLWNFTDNRRLRDHARLVLGGLSGGACVLMDYSGVVLLLALFVYALLKYRPVPAFSLVRAAGWYLLGSLPPLLLLWFYQWQSFGDPFHPAQHWMPAVLWINVGYQGVGLPQLDLMGALLADYRYGLFTSSPLMLLALAAPFLNRRGRPLVPWREFIFTLGTCLAFWVFCGSIAYGRLQFNTGIRYMAAALPFLFPAVVVTLVRLPFGWAYLAGVISVAQAWSMAMYRDVERGLGVLDPLVQVILGGFKLPVLSVLARMGGQYGDYFKDGTSPLPLFVLTAALLYGIWSARFDGAEVPRDTRELAKSKFSGI